jgi:hypothetical protein
MSTLDHFSQKEKSELHDLWVRQFTRALGKAPPYVDSMFRVELASVNYKSFEEAKVAILVAADEILTEHEELKRKREIIKAEMARANARLQTNSNFELDRKTEIDRFKVKWGEPDLIEPFEQVGPYVRLIKAVTVTIGNTTIKSKIYNSIPPVALIPINHESLADFDLEKWQNIGQGRINLIVELFKSNGFRVGEYFIGIANDTGNQTTMPMIADLLAEDEIKLLKVIQPEFNLIGLFALDKDDLAFITYRIEKKKSDSLPDSENYVS